MKTRAQLIAEYSGWPPKHLLDALEQPKAVEPPKKKKAPKDKPETEETVEQ
jgi:hypothetical protein